jgi:predicted short-subunit dehydrogenase-like oxidoreductase (DUF2520 family)
MGKKYRISVIGAGKVAWQLAQALEDAGHYIEEVWSRHPENAARLVDHLYAAKRHPSLDFRESRATLFLLSVTDKAVPELADELLLPAGAMLAHTSGTLPMEVLQPAATSYGVFYPLQTFSKEKKTDLSIVPFCLEASDAQGLKVLKKVAASLSNHVQVLNGAKRKVLHLAAVFASNFSNHMWRISEDILGEEGMDTQLLHPLIAETIEKSMRIGPARSQTGPAARGDHAVLEVHLQQLEERPEWAELYYLISQDIIRCENNS